VSALDFGLGLAGMPETTIAELDKQLPALQRIEAVFEQAQPHITALNLLYAKAQPDIVAVLPLVRDLIAFAKSKQG
jgi:hypothetical protein